MGGCFSEFVRFVQCCFPWSVDIVCTSLHDFWIMDLLCFACWVLLAGFIEMLTFRMSPPYKWLRISTTLFQQSVSAYRQGVLQLKTLKDGFECIPPLPIPGALQSVN